MSEINDALKKAADKRKDVTGSQEAVVDASTPIPVVPGTASFDKKKSIWPFLVLWLAIALTGALAFWLYSSWQAEKGLRAERDSELSRMTEELTQKQEELSELAQQKKELEDQFYANVAALEESTKDYEEKIKNIIEQMEPLRKENDSLTSENNALKIENADKDRNIAELSQKTAPSEQ